MKRGLALPPPGPGRTSALATTRRLRLQLFSVRHRNERNRRDAAPVCMLRTRERRSALAIRACSRLFPARPMTVSTPAPSAHASTASRQKPESVRRMMRTSGQCSRICRTIRSSTGVMSVATSFLALRKRAITGMRSQNTRSGRVQYSL